MVEDLAIEEENGDAGLAALGGVGKGIEKRHDVGSDQRVGVTFIVKEDEASHPGDGGFFGGGRIVASAQGVTYLIEQFWGLGWHSDTSEAKVKAKVEVKAKINRATQQGQAGRDRPERAHSLSLQPRVGGREATDFNRKGYTTRVFGLDRRKHWLYTRLVNRGG
jgi:hypothetical protein